MIINGRQIAIEIGEKLKREIVKINKVPALLVIQVGNEQASISFVRAKQKFADSVGITVEIKKFANSVSTNELMNEIKKANADPSIHGIIVQLPLPKQTDTKSVLDMIATHKDPDLLSSNSQTQFMKGGSKNLPPVVAAVAEIVERYKIDLHSADIVIIGSGKLVGEPIATWLKNLGVKYALITSKNEHPENILRTADVIISGAGKPGLIKPDMIKENCVLIDAGTSESPSSASAGGRSHRFGLVGDADPTCALKCSLFTPVPGGVGPIAVAMLFRNLLALQLSGLAAK